LHERMFPEQLPIRSEGRKDALRALHINIARFGIDGRAGSGVAVINDVTQEIAEKMLPQRLAGFGIEAGDPLLQVGAAAEIAHAQNPASNYISLQNQLLPIRIISSKHSIKLLHLASENSAPTGMTGKLGTGIPSLQDFPVIHFPVISDQQQRFGFVNRSSLY